MHKLHRGLEIPAYVSNYKFLKASLLTYEEIVDNTVTHTNKFSSYDSLKLLEENLKTQPADWHYRTKQITYKCNSNGYRSDEWNSINWKKAVVIFGCSCTVGVGLAEDETITHQLSNILNRPVVNIGVSASSMQFSFINSVLLSKNFPTPYAVVQLWTNVDRFTLFKEQQIEHLGPWDTAEIYKEFVNYPYHALTEATYISTASKELWKNRCRYYSASFFNQTAYYTESDWIEIDNKARDLVHPGRNSARNMAELIAKNIV